MSASAAVPPIDEILIGRLSDPVEDMRYCAVCDKLTIFRADRFCVSGFLGCCIICGDERFAPYTRTTTEAA